MKEVLIINLARMGDLVQITPLIAGLKEGYPDARLSLIINPHFSDICTCIPYIDRLFIFYKDGYTKMLWGEHSTVENFRYIENFLKDVNDTEYDLVINCTTIQSTAVLTSLIKAKEVRGAGIDDRGRGVIRHPWMKYLAKVVPDMVHNPFHLCDIYVKAGGVLPERKGLFLEVPHESQEWASSVLRETGIDDNETVVGFHLGAAMEIRRWPVRYFAELADRITDAIGAKVVLFGSGSEALLGEEFEALAKTKPLNFIGKTDVVKLAALLQRCRLVIGSDTGPLHISTAVGTKVLGIYLATAFYRTTGPYGEDHYVLSSDIPCYPCNLGVVCNDKVCKDAVKAENVFEVAKMALADRPPDKIEDSPIWEKVQAYRTCFKRDGLIDYRPLIKRDLSNDVLYNHIYRETWPKILDGQGDDRIEEGSGNLEERVSNWYNEKSVSRAFETGASALAVLKRFVELAEEGILKAAAVKKEIEKGRPDKERIENIRKDLAVIDKEIETVGSRDPFLHPLLLFFIYSKEEFEKPDFDTHLTEKGTAYIDLKAHSLMITRIILKCADFYAIPDRRKTC